MWSVLSSSTIATVGSESALSCGGANMRAVFHVYGFKLLRVMVMKMRHTLPTNLIIRIDAFPIGCTFVNTFTAISNRIVNVPGFLKVMPNYS